MSFLAREYSLDTGVPIRMYQFSRGPLRWCYCTADRDVTLQNIVFKSLPISDSGVRFTGEASADPLTITMPADADVPLMYRAVAPSEQVDLVVWDTHYGETDYAVVWVGSILSVRFLNPLTAEVNCAALSASLDRPGLTMSWQRPCPYSLYDSNCKVAEQNYKVTGTVDIANGLTVRCSVAASYPDGWFSGGYMEWEISAGVWERRGIRQHANVDMILLAGTHGIKAQQVVNIYPGCNRVSATCTNKFNNLLNFGGQPALPGRSPFDGNPVF